MDQGRVDPPGGDSGDDPDTSTLAGYRVMRRLGSGRRSVVYLGHAGTQEQPAGERVGRPVTVALKVFDPETDPASVERDVRALSQAPAGMLPGLVDVATLPDGRVCLVLELLTGPSLNRHLAEVGGLRSGEAVTILAPIVLALAALHEGGFAHEGLSLASVLFDGRGRPVLAGLGGLRDLPPEGVARIPALRADYRRLGVLVGGVLDLLDPDDTAVSAAAPLAAWLHGAADAVPFRPCLHQLERRLFGWAAAMPVLRSGPQAGPGAAALGADDRRSGARVDVDLARYGANALRVDGTHVALPDRSGPATGRPARSPALRLLALHLPPELRTALASALDGNPVVRAFSRLRERAGRHRRPLWFAVVAAAALVLLTIGVLPARTSTDVAGVSGGTGARGADVAAVSEGPTGVDPADRAVLSGDEPALAVPVLLRLRAGCLDAASIVCLDLVDQPGSAVMAADTYAARTTQQGGAVTDAGAFEQHSAGVVERTGNSALVAMVPPPLEGRPASVLVVKGEGGWRLREIFDY